MAQEFGSLIQDQGPEFLKILTSTIKIKDATRKVEFAGWSGMYSLHSADVP